MGNVSNPVLWALPLVLLVTAVLAAEMQQLKRAVTAYTVQGLVLAGLLALSGWLAHDHALYGFAMTVGISKGVILPYLLFRYAGVTKDSGTPLRVGVVAAAAIAILAFAGGEWFVPWVLAEVPGAEQLVPLGSGTAAAVIAVALWTLLVHRDTLKVIVGICLLENGVHLLLATIAASIPEAASIGVVIDVILSIWLLLLVGRQAESATGSRLDTTLDELRG